MVGKDGKEQVCRTLPGVRGLKCLMFCIGVVGVTVSHPTRGAWIEIVRVFGRHHAANASHPTRGAWIEILVLFGVKIVRRVSHPTRGAWIEIYSFKVA